MRKTSQFLVSNLFVVTAAACGSSAGAPAGASPGNPATSAGTSANMIAATPTGGTGASTTSMSPPAAVGGNTTTSGSSRPDAGTTSMTSNAAGTSTAGGAAGTGMSSAGTDTSASGGAAAGGGDGCGTRTGMRGKTSRSIMVGSAKRTFIAYLPDALSPSMPVPFVYVFHGATQNGSWLYDATEYAKLADTENIAVVFPDGQDTSSDAMTGSLTPWSVTDGPALCGAGSLVSNPNPVDFDFVDAIKKEIEQDQCLDDQHIFATGFSMGGYFSHHIACDRPDFRAAAPHSGATMASLDTCKTNHMPIIIFHGQADPLIAAGCDDPTTDAQSGFPAAATLWAKKNGCKDTYQTVPQPGTTMGNDGQCYVYDGCPADGQVELCAFASLQHAWAGAPTCQGCIGSGAGYASATKLEWEFFKKYAW